MTPRDRVGGSSGRRKGAGDAVPSTLRSGSAAAAEDGSSKLSDALRRAAYATATAACQGFRTASRTLCDAPSSPQRTLKAENLGKPSLGVMINAPWYESCHARRPGAGGR